MDTVAATVASREATVVDVVVTAASRAARPATLAVATAT